MDSLKNARPSLTGEERAFSLSKRGWLALCISIPLIRRLRRQLPPRGKPLAKPSGAAVRPKAFPWLGKVPRPSGADEVEAAPLHKGIAGWTA